jgi:hypothetical protein
VCICVYASLLDKLYKLAEMLNTYLRIVLGGLVSQGLGTLLKCQPT